MMDVDQLETAFCSIYVNCDAAPTDRLVANKPFYRSPFGPIAILQTLRLEKASGIVVGGPVSKLRSFLSFLAESDKRGELTQGKDPAEILEELKALASKYELGIEYQQVGPGKGMFDDDLAKIDLVSAVPAMVIENLTKARACGVIAESANLLTSVHIDSGVAILTVKTVGVPNKSIADVTSWEYGATSIEPDGITTSMVLHPDKLSFTDANSIDLAWSLWVRTGRPWSY